MRLPSSGGFRRRVEGLRAHLQGRLRQVLDRSDAMPTTEREAPRDDMELELLGAERETVNDLYQDGKLTAEARLRIERSSTCGKPGSTVFWRG